MDESDFNPLTTRVSGQPIGYLRSIVQRARALLDGKTSSEIREAQRQIEESRQTSFAAELDSAIDAETERLRRLALYEGDENAQRFFEILSDGEGGAHARLLPGMEDEFEDLPSIDDRTRWEYLLEMIEACLPVDSGLLADWTDCDFLAAHALALIEDAELNLRRVARRDDDDLQEIRLASELSDAVNALQRIRGLPDHQSPSIPEVLVRDAFALALEALDVVGKAELRRAASAANELKRLLSGQVSRANDEAATEREKRKLAAKVALVQRHAKTHELRAEVLNEWDKDRTGFSSAERAGEFFADWLEERGFRYQQRTVRDWIRAHAKKNGVLLR